VPLKKGGKGHRFVVERKIDWGVGRVLKGNKKHPQLEAKTGD